MGLEVLDIVLGTEDEFGINIPDEEMFDKVTVGLYYDYVLSKVREIEPAPGRTFAALGQPCHTTVAFNRIRRAFISAFGLARSDVKPESNLSSLLPRANRKQHWRHLKEAMDLPLPNLVAPVPVRTASAICWVALAIVTVSMLSGAIAFRWLLSTMALALGAQTLVAATATRLPAPTVGALAKSVVTMNYGALAVEPRGWTDKEVWLRLQALIVDRLKVLPSQVTREANWYNDLGCG